MNTSNKKHFSMSIVLLGDFQPAMFQPDWFLKNEVITQIERDAIVNNKTGHMIVSNVATDFETGALSFHIDQQRFQILGKKEPFEEVVDAFKKIFNSLSTLSVSAYGINYFFHLEAEKKEMDTIGKNLAPRQYWGSLFSSDDAESGLMSITMRKAKEYGFLNVTIESSRILKGIFMNYNFHHVKKNTDIFAIGEIESEIEQNCSQCKNEVLMLTNEIIDKVTIHE